jgi:purine-binding chemotaxis protein CheW
MRVLLVSADSRLCALPLAYVNETMRPQPCHPIPDVPAFVLGVSTIRGIATPVADLGLLLGGRALEAPSRLVTLRLDDSRTVALLADGVRGVESIEARGILPPLIRDTAVIQELGRLDAELLTVLDCGRLLTDEQWQALGGPEQRR